MHLFSSLKHAIYWKISRSSNARIYFFSQATLPYWKHKNFSNGLNLGKERARKPSSLSHLSFLIYPLETWANQSLIFSTIEQVHCGSLCYPSQHGNLLFPWSQRRVWFASNFTALSLQGSSLISNNNSNAMCMHFVLSALWIDVLFPPTPSSLFFFPTRFLKIRALGCLSIRPVQLLLF